MPGKWQLWYPHLIDAWQGSGTIQTFSHAAYRGFHNLIMEQFQSPDGMLPDDDKQLAKMSRLGFEWAAVASEVREALTSSGDGRVYSQTQYELWKDAHKRHEDYLGRMQNARVAKSQRNAQSNTQNKELLNTQTNDKSMDALTETETETEIEKTTKAKAAPPKAPLFVLPDWISSEVWKAFEEMRRKIKKPMTDRARCNILARLVRFEAMGFHAERVLDQSITNSWQDVYELKPESVGVSGKFGNRGPVRVSGNPMSAEVMAEHLKAEELATEKSEAEAYAAWLSMSDAFKQANPWTGKIPKLAVN